MPEFSYLPFLTQLSLSLLPQHVTHTGKWSGSLCPGQWEREADPCGGCCWVLLFESKGALIPPLPSLPLKYAPQHLSSAENPRLPQALSLGVGISLCSPVVTTGSEAGAQMDDPEGSFSSFFLPPGLFFQLGKPDALEFNYMLQLETQNVSAGKGESYYK